MRDGAYPVSSVLACVVAVACGTAPIAIVATERVEADEAETPRVIPPAMVDGTAPREPPVRETPRADPAWTRAARFYAGMPADEDGLESLRDHLGWKAHARVLDESWARASAGRLRAMREWASSALTDHERSSVVLYPLGGPDALHAISLFPEAATLVLVGLEPVGEAPQPDTLNAVQRSAGLDGIRASLSYALHWGFFATENMERDLHNAGLPGVLPILLATVARAGHAVTGVRWLSVDEAGRLVPRPAERESAVPAVEVVYAAGGSTRSVIYLRADLSRPALEHDARALTFLSSFDAPTCLLKAASYMLHRPDFVAIRDAMLGRCATIVQDPSGIPFRMLTGSQWELELHGGFGSPVPLFAEFQQPEMQRAFVRGGSRPLGFSFGYRDTQGRSGVIVARRR